MTALRLYPRQRYDHGLRLKMPPLLWLALINGLHHLICLVPPAHAALGPAAQLLGDWRLAAPDLAALAVLLTSGFRVPGARPLARRFWHAGRHSLIGAYLFGVALFLHFDRAVFAQPDGAYFVYAVGIVLVDLAVVAYLLRSQLVRDVFADFPEPADAQRCRIAPGVVELRRRRAQELLVRHPAAAAVSDVEARLRERLAANPEDAPAWHDLGLVALQAERLEQACDFVRQATLVDGANAVYLRNLGELCRRQGNVAEALRAGLAATRMAPAAADAHYNLALAWAQAGRLQQAAASYRAAIERNPRHADAWNNLGVLYRHLGDDNAARQAFAQALQIAPQMAAAAANLSAAANAR
ncbi:MAG: tetratricopeptide repeat protein [Rhodocyclaceae bacterium]|nr:tetratricopeptide repeat protein [Rhodocyclaceae bacterium]